MQVKVVSLKKCGATASVIGLVKETAEELGIPIELTHVVVQTDEEAAAHRHLGSPTIQINGLDIERGARNIKQFGLS